MGVGHGDHEVAPCVGASRDHPIAVRRHDDVQTVPHWVGIEALGLDHQRLLGDDRLEDRFMRLSPAKKASSANSTEHCCRCALKWPVR